SRRTSTTVSRSCVRRSRRSLDSRRCWPRSEASRGSRPPRPPARPLMAEVARGEQAQDAGRRPEPPPGRAAALAVASGARSCSSWWPATPRSASPRRRARWACRRRRCRHWSAGSRRRARSSAPAGASSSWLRRRSRPVPAKTLRARTAASTTRRYRRPTTRSCPRPRRSRGPASRASPARREWPGPSRYPSPLATRPGDRRRA
ncbi:MAG: hypothetical protein AVDCRST_MAG45-2639, partial [uncultured Solirubrobacterales bacterium]